MNFDTKFQEVKRLFTIRLRRLITPLGRITILKSLILSKLVHLWLLWPDPSDTFIDLQKRKKKKEALYRTKSVIE